ncbi:DUF4168 domain-containing protein [Aquicoccus sp. SCR17]|nr:DUF4168 domain-containing protein [Carideicomes alvinocaridis]
MTLRKTLLGSTMVLGLVAAPVAPVLAQSADSSGDMTQGSTSEMTQDGSSDMAQDGTAGTAQDDADGQSAQASAGDYTDEELETFVTAAMEISNVRRSYTPRIQSAETPEDQQALAEEAQSEMIAAIEAVEGMDVETFNEIGEAAQKDEDLSARIVEMARAQQSEMQDSTDEG